MKGRPFLGAVSGLLFGLSLAGFLLTIGVLATDSVLLIVLPVVLLLAGVALAAIAPFKRSRLDGSTTAPAPAAPPAE